MKNILRVLCIFFFALIITDEIKYDYVSIGYAQYGQGSVLPDVKVERMNEKNAASGDGDYLSDYVKSVKRGVNKEILPYYTVGININGDYSPTYRSDIEIISAKASEEMDPLINTAQDTVNRMKAVYVDREEMEKVYGDAKDLMLALQNSVSGVASMNNAEKLKKVSYAEGQVTKMYNKVRKVRKELENKKGTKGAVDVKKKLADAEKKFEEARNALGSATEGAKKSSSISNVINKFGDGTTLAFAGVDAYLLMQNIENTMDNGWNAKTSDKLLGSVKDNTVNFFGAIATKAAAPVALSDLLIKYYVIPKFDDAMGSFEKPFSEIRNAAIQVNSALISAGRKIENNNNISPDYKIYLLREVILQAMNDLQLLDDEAKKIANLGVEKESFWDFYNVWKNVTMLQRNNEYEKVSQIIQSSRESINPMLKRIEKIRNSINNLNGEASKIMFETKKLQTKSFNISNKSEETTCNIFKNGIMKNNNGKKGS